VLNLRHGQARAAIFTFTHTTSLRRPLRSFPLAVLRVLLPNSGDLCFKLFKEPRFSCLLDALGLASLVHQKRVRDDRTPTTDRDSTLITPSPPTTPLLSPSRHGLPLPSSTPQVTMSTPSSTAPETDSTPQTCTPSAGADEGSMDEIPRRQMRGKPT